MGFVLGQRSLTNLAGVHPRLVAVVKRAIEITPLDFTITEGLRTRKRQVHLVSIGASKTLNSRHLTGHAVDFAVIVGGVVHWDWPLYTRVSAAFKQAALEQGTKITWGGDFKSFKDGPHIEINPKDYPH